MDKPFDLSDIGEHTHCDDYAADPAGHPAARKYIDHARSPGHGMMQPKPHPKLFATYDGVRVRVVSASRLGDVGITSDLTAEYGYELRVFVDQLTDFGEEP